MLVLEKITTLHNPLIKFHFERSYFYGFFCFLLPLPLLQVHAAVFRDGSFQVFFKLNFCGTYGESLAYGHLFCKCQTHYVCFYSFLSLIFSSKCLNIAYKNRLYYTSLPRSSNCKKKTFLYSITYSTCKTSLFSQYLAIVLFIIFVYLL